MLASFLEIIVNTVMLVVIDIEEAVIASVANFVKVATNYRECFANVLAPPAETAITIVAIS